MLRLTFKIGIALIAVSFVRPALAQTGVKISEVLRDPKAHSEEQIVVFGKVRELTRWDRFDTFMLCKAKCLNVFVWGHPRISEGQDLNVRGIFHLIKEINHHKVRNVLEVDEGSLGFLPRREHVTAANLEHSQAGRLTSATAAKPYRSVARKLRSA